MSKTRDMSQTQYEQAMREHGFAKDPFMGYWTLPAPLSATHISDWNAGDRRRDKLAYMLKRLEEEEFEFNRNAAALAGGNS